MDNYQLLRLAIAVIVAFLMLFAGYRIIYSKFKQARRDGLVKDCVFWIIVGILLNGLVTITVFFLLPK